MPDGETGSQWAPPSVVRMIEKSFSRPVAVAHPTGGETIGAAPMRGVLFTVEGGIGRMPHAATTPAGGPSEPTRAVGTVVGIGPVARGMGMGLGVEVAPASVGAALGAAVGA